MKKVNNETESLQRDQVKENHITIYSKDHSSNMYN